MCFLECAMILLKKDLAVPLPYNKRRCICNHLRINILLKSNVTKDHTVQQVGLHHSSELPPGAYLIFVHFIRTAEWVGVKVGFFLCLDQIRSDQSLSRVRLFATPWIAAHQASLSITNSRSLLRLTFIESVMPSSHLILCCPLLLALCSFSLRAAMWPSQWPLTPCVFSL